VAKDGLPGVEIKVLLEDKDTGLLTSLTRMARAQCCRLHEHADVEQTYVIEGRLVDEEARSRRGICLAAEGQYPRCDRAEGALLLGMFLRPNRFL